MDTQEAVTDKVESVHKRWVVYRKYSAGEMETFYFKSLREAQSFVEDRINEMKLFANSSSMIVNSLFVNFTISLNGSYIWNVLIPVSSKYKNNGNLICMFKISEEKDESLV